MYPPRLFASHGLEKQAEEGLALRTYVWSMPARIDHVAVETDDPQRAASFYERVLGARVVKEEGHPTMVYLQVGAVAFHEPGGPGPHMAFRVSEEERAEIARRLSQEGIEYEERDHEIAVGLFFEDPDGRRLEAITYRGADDPRRP
jgi:catechol 2,3-dioxygenase-like lactoylglutathione lyase family enzyme